MVFYFSGTGNSKYAAQRIAEALDEPLLSLNADLRMAHPAHRARASAQNGAARRGAGVVRHDLRQRDRQRRPV